MLNDFIARALLYLGTTAGTIVLAYVAKFIHTRVKNEFARGVLDRLVDTVAIIVAEAEQTLVAKITTLDGPLTDAQGKQILEAVLDKLRTHLGSKGLAELNTIFEPDKLHEVLVSYVEAKVREIGASHLAAPARRVPAVTVDESTALAYAAVTA